MKSCLLLPPMLALTSALAQTVSVSPMTNALGVPRTSSVAVTVPGGPNASAALRVFSQQSGGLKAGITTRAGNTLTFWPTVGFVAGETVSATFVPGTGGGAGRVWQFTVAAGGSGLFGGGTDTYITAYPFGTTLTTIAIGDLDSDRTLDVAVGEIGTNPSSIFTNDGRGGLSRLTYFPGASYTRSRFPPFGDVDGDGLLDLVRSRNTGPARFVPIPNTVPFVASLYAGTQGDFDGDGDLDYATCRRSVSGQELYVYWNDGTGALSLGPNPVALPFEGALSAGDLDNDGDLDLVCFPALSTNTLVLLNDGLGGYAVTATYFTPVFTPLDLAYITLGDVDGDGDLDMVVPATAPNPTTSPVWLNNGQGAFTPRPSPALASSMAYSIALGDVDGDGDLDALTSGGGAQLLLNDGQGNFSSHYAVPGMNAYGGALLADMNNDGALDIVTAQPGSTPGNPGTGQPGRLAVRLSGGVTATRVGIGQAPLAWPNPVTTDGFIYLKDQPTTRNQSQFTLRTLLGANVRMGIFAASAGVRLSVDDLAPGVYLLTVQTEGLAPRTERLVIE